MQAKGISWRGSAPSLPAWVRSLLARRAEPAPELPSAAQREVCAALHETAPERAGFGDCFVFGRCAAQHELALAGALRQLGHGDARTFSCVDGAQRVHEQRADQSSAGAGYITLDTSDFDTRTLAALRQRHRVRSVSVVMVAEDFALSLGRVVHGLAGLLAARACLLVAGQQAALVEALWFDELRRGQHAFEITRMREPASAWARFRLQRRHQV